MAKKRKVALTQGDLDCRVNRYCTVKGGKKKKGILLFFFFAYLTKRKNKIKLLIRTKQGESGVVTGQVKLQGGNTDQELTNQFCEEERLPVTRAEEDTLICAPTARGPMEQPSMPLWLSTFEEDIDTYIFISSRDNKLYLGILRTYDQHGNIFLTHCVEKIIVPDRNCFSDVYVGNLIIRGDNIAYFGSVDEDKYAKMFDYSQPNKGGTEAEATPEGDLPRSQGPLPPENVVLQYKPINQILGYLPDNNHDFAVFEN
ncbi:LSM domain-containing protein [Plasmodium vivax Brazil I]|uniref:U6 snRNA-associated Sm-like protein LSm1 n=1 Tax=Plasmodium vivax (strain Brazil I) TaxID=1033975 RepID=A0A0J9SUN1_PLAV1|nr:LSM domain-containing protein [Plasmodium vivax Brazil I]